MATDGDSDSGSEDEAVGDQIRNLGYNSGMTSIPGTLQL